jgi:hypothetical protein
LKAETAQPLRFVRRTGLRDGEYNTNFRMLDRDSIDVVTSKEADRVTPLMGKIYLRLVNAPDCYKERDRVLCFTGEVKEEGRVKAWDQLCQLLGVASATANKALAWMHEQGVIGYYAGKNGVGIRIFLNRATSSIARRDGASGQGAPVAGKKILQFAPASSHESRASQDEAAFKDNFVDEEVSENLFNSRAQKTGAADKKMVDKKDSETRPAVENEASAEQERREFAAASTSTNPALSIDEIVRRIRSEIEPAVESAAERAAQREHERTREWLESKGLPKAARVAQREAYNVLRQNGVINSKGERVRADLEVGRNDYAPAAARPLSVDEIKTYAEMCVAMLETHGQAVDVTLAELSSEAGGPILANDAPLVRAEAKRMIDSLGRKEK